MRFAGVVTDIGPAVPPDHVSEGDSRPGLPAALMRALRILRGGHSLAVHGRFAIDSAPRLTDGKGRPVRAGLRVGGFAESVVVDSSQVVKIPADVADDAACLISCGVLTGFGAAINTARIQVGDSVAVVGCGGVGLNCVQGAAARGGRSRSWRST